MTKTLLLLAATSALFITACRKNLYDPGLVPVSANTDIPPGKLNLGAVMASLAPQYKEVTINAATGGTFRGNSGTRYVFPPNSFVTQTGLPVTGNVQVRVVEVLDEADMLFSGVLPSSNGEPLLSGGEVFVGATQGGQPLAMAEGKSYEARMPQAGVDANGMGLFLGTEDTGKKINWRPVAAGGAGGMIFTVGDTVGISSGTLAWCNADRFMTTPHYQNFTVRINTGGLNYSEDSILIHAVYDQYVGAWPIGRGARGYGRSEHPYWENHVPNIPVHFVASAVIRGNFYAAILGATPQTGKNYTLNLKLTTPAEFKAQVKAL
jgi:hypothetical protein